MRFVILTQYFLPESGAAQVRLGAMVRALRQQGHEIEIVTALPNYPAGKIFPAYRRKFYVQEVWEGAPVHRVWLYPALGAGGKRMINYLSFMMTSLWPLMRTHRPDYLFVESPPLFLSLPAWVYSAVRRVPVIFNVADLWPDSVMQFGVVSNDLVLRIAKGLERWSYRTATYVNAVTEGIRQVLIDDKGVPPEKVLFLPNGIDIAAFRPLPPDEHLKERLGLAGKKVLLYAGTMGYAHGCEVAVQAMSYLRVTYPDLHLLLVGGGSERERLRMLAQHKGLLNVNVSFLDPIPPEEVARLYSIAFAGVVTLRDLPLFEGTRPAKMFPIMASGKPVIYSGAGEGARLVERAGAGVVVPPEDAEALATAIQRLVAEPKRAARLGAQGRAFAERELSWERVIGTWLEELAARSGRSA